MALKTRILYVITKATLGGAQKYVWDLAAHARENEAYEPLLAYGEPGALSERAHALGVRTFWVKGLSRDPSPLHDLTALRGLYTLFKDQRPDVVHLNSSKAGFLGALAAYAARVPRVIFTSHGWAFTERRNPLSRALYQLLHRATVALSTVTIAVSEFVRAPALAWVPEERVVHIPLGIGPFTLFSREEARKRLILKDPALREKADAFWVGTIAELHDNKGIDIAIEAMKRLPAHAPPMEWVIIGNGEKEARLKKQARGLGQVHFVGAIADASEYLQAFDLFLLPSRSEAFGYVVLEAGVAGLPAMVSGAGGTKEFTDRGVAARFISEDPTSLARTLAALVGNPHELARLKKALHAEVAERHSLPRMLEDTFRVYQG